jgi:L-lactate dehydrogenase complex protein LldE
MKVGLFIPCYVNQFYPAVGIATLELLEKFGLEVHFPLNQTCCGQPMANAGFEHLSKDCNKLFLKNFDDFDYIVSPSGSCVLHVKDHLKVSGHEETASSIRSKIFELTEFLVDILDVKKIESKFTHRVGLHQSCHGQRGLRLSSMSERIEPSFSKTEKLLAMVEGIELVELSRKDECCGFGGTFCVSEEAVSVKMGKDRIADHLAHGATYITGNDMSCLMHLEGIMKRNKSAVKAIHIAEILNGVSDERF